ncbi:hypothetical protein D3C73_1503990 [compost metagenome]
MPTLAYLMGVDESKYINTALGRNLLKTNKSFAVMTNRSVRGTLTEEEKEFYINSLELSDKMIKSDYFENYYNK